MTTRANALDAQIQNEKERISDTFIALSSECSAVLEEKRKTAMGTIDSLSKNLHSAFGGIARISRDVEEKTAALSALYAKATADGPRSQKRAAAKRVREILEYLDACYAPLLDAPLPELGQEDVTQTFRPVVSVGSSVKSFNEHVKDYASLVDN